VLRTFILSGKNSRSVFLFGGAPKGKPIRETAPHHTPDFYIDESGFKVGNESIVRPNN
jgi:hypothetical protein